MKFAIYGDSYAAASAANKPDPKLNSLAWTTVLAQRLGATTIDYYAQSGTSFFYSYQKIMDTARQYDRIIVAVTQSTRYTKSINGYYFVSPVHVNHAKDYGLDYHTVSKLNAWFGMSDIEFMDTAQELMIRAVESHSPGAVLVPSFPQSFTGTRADRWHNFGLCNINSIMRDQLSLHYVGWRPGVHPTYEIRNETGILCHIPVEWQSATADIVYNFLANGSINVPELKLQRTIDYYYSGT
jgi:hypothetical protein